MVHSSSEDKDTTINSYINQDAKIWWLTWLLNDWDPSLLITPTAVITSLLVFLYPSSQEKSEIRESVVQQELQFFIHNIWKD